MTKERGFWWMVKMTVVLPVILNSIFNAYEARDLKNNNLNETNSHLLLRGEQKLCKDESKTSFHLGRGMEWVEYVECSEKCSCGKNHKCVKINDLTFNRDLCVRECNGHNDCEYPQKCQMKEKYCYYEKCQSNADCENSLICDTAGVLKEKRCGRECNCGPHEFSCRFDYDQKKCRCNSYAVEMNGVCVDVRTTSQEVTSNSVEISTIAISTEKECYCGENSKFCRVDWKGDKECQCFSGYADNKGYCDECNCGPYGLCRFEYNRKKCNCESFAVELNGVCVDVRTTSQEVTTNSVEISTIASSTAEDCHCGFYSFSCFLDFAGNKVCNCFPGYSQLDGLCSDCNCGGNSISCHFNWRGDKVCNCTAGYDELYGLCRECNCGAHARSCFYRKNATKVCNCDYGYTQIDEHCSAKCSEGKCVHGKCEIIDNGFKCRCNEGFTGERCEHKVQIKSNKQDLWLILLLSVAFAIFVLLFGIFCLLINKLKKRSKN